MTADKAFAVSSPDFLSFFFFFPEVWLLNTPKLSIIGYLGTGSIFYFFVSTLKKT